MTEPIESTDQIENDQRRSRHVPRMPSVIPNYPSHQTPIQQSEFYFDQLGQPLIATAEEISPNEDYPFNFLLRFGEAFSYYFMRGRHLWPINIRHNPVIFYLLGKRSDFRVTDILIPFFFVLIAISETGWVLFNDYMILSGMNFPRNAPNVMTLVVPFILFGIIALSTRYHFHLFANKETLEQLILTRLTPQEVTYGIVIRFLMPFALGAFLYVLSTILLAVISSISFAAFYELGLFTDYLPVKILVSLALSFFKSAAYLFLSMVTIVTFFHRQFAPKHQRIHRFDGSDLNVDHLIPLAYVGFFLVFGLGFLKFNHGTFFLLLYLGALIIGLLLQLQKFNDTLNVLQWHFKKPFGTAYIESKDLSDIDG